MKNKYHFIFIFCLFISNFSISQLFPNPVMLSTGQGTPGDPDPLWTCSPWYTAQPTDPSAATYTPALINNNCAPGSWVNPASLPAPVNNGNWITGQESNCSQNTSSGYRFFRLQLDLPNDCNGFSVTQPGNYSLSFVGYVDNKISEVYLNNSPLGISGGSFTPGSQISFTINGPWLVGTNYIDVLVYNTPAGNPNANNPYGLLLVADANSLNGNDTDGDGISDLFDECPCTPGNNSVGCADNSTCDIDSIRTAFTNAGCQELQGCWDECSMYFLNPQYLSGSAAQSFAQTLGANLISIQSAAENACILSDLNRLGYGSGDVIWIGFNDEAVENQFVWYDQSPVVYTNWAPGEPNNSGGNENCVQIYPGGSNPGTWNDLKCNGYNSLSVIEVNLCPVTSVTPPITMCQETDTTIKVLSTILGSSPYTYEWDNNSTQTSQSISPMQSTNYYITTKDRYSCSTNDTVFVTVNNLPTADFTSDAGCQENMTVNFSNSSTVQGNEVLSSAWSFGNGQTSVDSNPQNVYVNYGGYTVTLIVSTVANCRDTVTHNISLFPKPTADFTYDANCSNNPTITFNNTSSSPDNGVLTYSWNLGGNQSSTDINPTVTLPNPTGNMVTLIVTSANNCKDTIIKSVDAKVQPVASFTANAACINETVSFSNTSVIANNTNVTYNWNLGNGQTSTTKNPSTTYTTSGNQSVTLIATGENGCADTITKQVTVYVTPSLPVITSNAPIECPGDDFTFSGNAVNGASYFWSGPQAFTSTERENTITAETENQGDYSLFISVNGCKSDVATITMSISGNNNPTRYDFPNVITPNGDGVNDVLDMDAYFSTCLEYKIEIFNRWGLKVFEQSSGNAAFEGKDQKSGATLSEGTYFYKLTYGNEVVQGFLNIAR